jgi:asparagine synthase (glutamine-hydrolysing)
MCGIVAIVGDVKNKESQLKKSLSKIIHRGDHAFEYKIFDHIAFGANRLAIVDEDFGHQPQENEHGTVFAIQNGEIFNFLDLTKRLAAGGHTFRTHSDTEVLVHLWERYKERMVFELDSEMFAFIIFDKETGNVFAARDRIGIKPLYYAYDNNGNLYFASEIKALVCLEEIEEVHEFPPGHYFFQNTFVKYFELTVHESKHVDLAKFVHTIERAVSKRVQTELPIAVFLSGGVDSSLTMELATRFHNNVTALVLGETSSSDYIHATKLCRDKGWHYKTLDPKINYEEGLSDIIYFVESYDPNVIRHSYANDIISKYAHELGFKIVLTGEGIDEIFGGYNEFLDIDTSKINLGCQLLLSSLSRGNLMRIDKMAMRHTVEIRCPFFDQELVDLAMSIDGSLKVGEYGGRQFTKLIFRKIAAGYLPEYIAFREKAAFANGAGMNIGINYTQGDGVLNDLASRLISDGELSNIQHNFPHRDFKTKEEVLLFERYRQYGYDSFIEGRTRLVVKDTLDSI